MKIGQVLHRDYWILYIYIYIYIYIYTSCINLNFLFYLNVSLYLYWFILCMKICYFILSCFFLTKLLCNSAAKCMIDVVAVRCTRVLIKCFDQVDWRKEKYRVCNYD